MNPMVGLSAHIALNSHMTGLVSLTYTLQTINERYEKVQRYTNGYFSRFGILHGSVVDASGR